MNINIGNNRWVKFTRTVGRTGDGEWRGRGFGYRFRATRVGTQWQCTVWLLGGSHSIVSCTAYKMKSAIQEGARLGDAATTELELTCPT